MAFVSACPLQPSATRRLSAESARSTRPSVLRSPRQPVYVPCIRVQPRTFEFSVHAQASVQKNELVRAISTDGSISCRVLIASELVRTITSLHDCSPTAMAALGRTLCGAVLLADGKKDGESVQLDFRGDGPIQRVMAIADSHGKVRGLCADPHADVPPRPDGKLDVASLVGKSGDLYVVRYHPSMREPYTGIVSLVNGEIAEDILSYLVESEQIPSALGLGVYVGGLKAGSRPTVETAGGFLVQVLPGASEEELTRLETNVRSLPPATEILRRSATANDVVNLLLEGIGTRERHSSEPEFFCQCDESRVERAIALLPLADVQEMADKGEPLEIRCEFCSTKYCLSVSRLRQLLDEKKLAGRPNSSN